jgi:hypothetical protein
LVESLEAGLLITEQVERVDGWMDLKAKGT